MEDLVLSIKNLVKYYPCKRRKLLDNISFDVKKGSVLGIIGPSGCGKTTLLKIISGIVDYDEGVINSNYNKIGFVFQEDMVFPWLSVWKNISMFVDDGKVIEKVLRLCKIYDYKDIEVWKLSGGMKKRVELARALSVKPELILFDEPLVNIDYPLKIKLIDDIKELIRSESISAIYVSHDIREVLEIANDIIVFSYPPTRVVKRIVIDEKSTLDFLEFERSLMSMFNGLE